MPPKSPFHEAGDPAASPSTRYQFELVMQAHHLGRGLVLAGSSVMGLHASQRQLHLEPSGLPFSSHHWHKPLGRSVMPSHGPLPCMRVHLHGEKPAGMSSSRGIPSLPSASPCCSREAGLLVRAARRGGLVAACGVA